MQYYDINEESKYVFLNDIINTEIDVCKHIKKDFLRRHKYIFNNFSKDQTNCVRDYYGVDDGNFKTFTEVAKNNNVSEHMVRYYIQNFFQTLRLERYVNLLYEYNDEDLGYTEEKSEEFDLDEVYNGYIRKIMQGDKERFNSLSKEEKRAELCFKELLNKSLYRFDWFNGTTITPSMVPLSVGDALKRSTKEMLKERDYKEFFNKLRSYGLSFQCEHKYIKDWEEDCLDGIKKYGVDKLVEEEDLLISENIDLLINLKRPVDRCPFTNGIKTVFRRCNIETIKDLILYSVNDLMKVRNVGPKVIGLIENILYNMGLSLRPEGKDKREWLEFVLNDGLTKKENKKEEPKEQTKVGNKEEVNKDVKADAPDFSKLPEEYRKYYVMGVASEVEKDIKTETPFNTLKNRMISKYSPKRIPESDNTPLKVKFEEDIIYSLERIKKDLILIKSLPSKFINENKDALIMMLFENKDYDATIRKELLDFILEQKEDEHLQ